MRDWADLEGDPYVTVERVGRWSYIVTLHHGLMMWTPAPMVFGRVRAERKATRMLAKYRQQQQWKADARRVVS